MTDLTTEQRIRGMLAEFFGPSNEQELKIDTQIFGSHAPGGDTTRLGDSLDRVEFAMMLELEFGIEMTDLEGELANTIESMVALVELKKPSTASGN